VPYNDVEALDAAITDTTAGVILEPIQAEGGIIVGTDAYLRAARRLCDERGALLLFDEVQTGYGRTGRFLGAEHSGVVPDACALAKGIAGGFPLGALAVTGRVAGGLPPGTHASTFGGNPLACAAGLAVLRIFEQEGLVDNAERMGATLWARLGAMVADAAIPAAVEARGRGLLQGVRLQEGVDPAGVLAGCRDGGVLLSLAGGDVLRFTPPLNVTAEELDEGLVVVEKVLREVSA
jgi:acetylornithine/N-succinyldiaminopimelate aminotransferase